jgi:hypothetical protein
MNTNPMRALLIVCSVVLIPNIASAYYAAHMGRWTSRDPFGEIGRIGVEARPNPGTNGDFLARDRFDPMGAYHDGMNLYQYVRSKPVNAVDPSGLGNLRWPFNSRICNSCDTKPLWVCCSGSRGCLATVGCDGCSKRCWWTDPGDECATQCNTTNGKPPSAQEPPAPIPN